MKPTDTFRENQKVQQRLSASVAPLPILGVLRFGLQPRQDLLGAVQQRRYLSMLRVLDLDGDITGELQGELPELNCIIVAEICDLVLKCVAYVAERGHDGGEGG
jgi:hypothetical protein